MSEGFAPRAQADWFGRLELWRRRYGLYVATAVVFSVSCLLGVAATSAAFHAFAPIP